MENNEDESKNKNKIECDINNITKTPVIHSLNGKDHNIFSNNSLMRVKSIIDSDFRSSNFSLDLLYRQKKEKELLQSIANFEDITKENMKLAETIDFKNIPDSIVKCDEYGFLLDDERSSKESNSSKYFSDKNVIKNAKEKSENLLKINARIEKWNFMLNNFKEFQTNK